MSVTNEARFIGRVVKAPEKRGNSQNAPVRYRIAVDRTFKNKEGKYESDFLTIVAFGRSGDFALDKIKVGDTVGVIGEIRNGVPYEKDGKTVYPDNDIIVSEQRFVGSKADANAAKPKKQAAPAPDEDEDDELPY